MVDLSNLTPSPKSHLRFVPACWENRRPAQIKSEGWGLLKGVANWLAAAN